ncbi:MAG: hypothetical protein LBS72_09305 [Oscillospiraceae bacterium]|jgi:hypothetical protein|nr:hypothetical protein [Oscillospiraceae bacterium]
MTLFGTNHPFNLTAVPFSRKGAFLSIYENPGDGQLYFTHCRSEGVSILRPNLIRIAFMDGSVQLPFIYEADEAKLTVRTPKGTAEFTYDGPQIIRMRLKGISTRLFYEPEMHEGADIRAANELEIGINFMGKLLFKGIAGGFTTTAKWNFREVRPFPFTIDIFPTGEGAAEAAVHEYDTSGLPLPTYRPFEEAEAETRADFEAFAKAYPPVPEIWADDARLAAWVVWMSAMGPRGSLKEPALYMHKLLLVRTFVWHHGYAAMSMRGDARQAWQYLLTFFQFQDPKYGGLPDNASDKNQENWVSTKPPIFGYALCNILDTFDLSSLTREDYQRAYDKLVPYRKWWFVHHDHAKKGFPSYYHVDESGYDEASLFERGLPLMAPDLMAYMITLDEALAKLAEKLGKPEEARRWMAESKRTLAFLTEELWDGEQFRAKVTKTGELFKCGCAAQLQPIMLGKRLPKEIVRKIRDRVLDESEFLTEYGVASENKKSEQFRAMSFTRGPVIAPVNMQIISGLYDAGEAEAARVIAIRYLRSLSRFGPVLGALPYRVDPNTWQAMQPYDKNPIGNPMTAWAASIFLAIAGRFFPDYPQKNIV